MAKKQKKDNTSHQLEIVTKKQVTTIDLPDEPANQASYEQQAAPQEEGMIRGSVIAIAGIPKPKANVHFPDAIQVITAAAKSVYDTFSIIHETDIQMMSKDKIAEMLLDVKGRPEIEKQAQNYLEMAQISAALHQVAFSKMEELEDVQEADRLSAMTSEEQAAETALRAAIRKRMNDEAAADFERRRMETLTDSFDIAEKWANTPGLTHTEVAHGVAHDFYEKYVGRSNSYDANGQPLERDLGHDYRNHYESQLKKRIESRTMRSARELFGK